MLIIGEKLNSSIPSVLKALQENDEAFLINLIKCQEEAGASFLDINAAMCGDEEAEKLKYLAAKAEKYSRCGLVLDSPSPEIIRSLLPLVKNRPVIVNSVTITERFDELMPIIEREGAAVIALPVDEDGSGQTIESRRNKIDVLVKKFAERDFPHERIFIDIIAETLAANNQSALLALDSIAYINSAYPQIKSVCGLSNISFGLPKRININGAFLTAAVLSGLSAAIMDNTAPAMELYLKTALLIGGKDKNCLKYIKLIRALEKQNI